MEPDKLHGISSRLASEAEMLLRHDRAEAAIEKYKEAAEWEEKALGFVTVDKARTAGILAVSVVSLYYKAEEYDKAQDRARDYLLMVHLPDFAIDQLQELKKEAFKKGFEKFLKEEANYEPGENSCPELPRSDHEYYNGRCIACQHRKRERQPITEKELNALIESIRKSLRGHED